MSDQIGDDFPEIIRACRKVLRMVSELHLRGYQRLRIYTGLSPSGAYWRCYVLPADRFDVRQPWEVPDPVSDEVGYSSADGRKYFGLHGVEHAHPGRLADRFIETFPRLVGAGEGRDWSYAGWYVEMLHLTYPDVLPVMFEDYLKITDHVPCRGRRERVEVPLPPPPVPEGTEMTTEERLST